MRKLRSRSVDRSGSASSESTPVPSLVPAESGRRVSYEPGALFWCRDEAVQIEAPSGSGFRVRRLRSGGNATVGFHELEPLPVAAQSPPAPAINANMAPVESAEWERARALEVAIRGLMEQGSLATGAQEAATAASVGLSARQFRRWCVRYQKNPTVAALVRESPGRKAGRTRVLATEVEQLMEEVICRELKVSPDIPVDVLRSLIVRECRLAGLEPPGRSTIALRLKALRAKPANLPAAIATELAYRQAPVRGSLITTEALQVVQIDHTLCDVIIVDSQDRKPIGRPVLTLAIDVHTRVILGMLLTLEAPSSLSVGLCLQHAVFPKDRWLQGLGVAPGTWPGFGVPKALHLDNAKEFHALALERGCHHYRVELIYRPVGDPKVGGTIERVIGTCMGRVRLIPGATFCKQLQDRPRKTERLARFTLEELYQYLAGEVAQYHLRRHRILTTSPKLAWEQAWQINGVRHYPELPEDAAAFLVQFLPLERRVVTREGIALFGLRYQSHELHDLIRPDRKRTLRFDPRNLSQIYVEYEDAQSHLVVPLIHPDAPAFSIWEWREIRQRRLVMKYPGDALTLETAVVKNRQMIREGASARRALRKGRRTQREREWRAVEPLLPAPPAQDPAPLKIVSRTEEGPYPCDVLE